MDIKNIVQKISNRVSSHNPFEIADSLNIRVLYLPLGNTLGYFTKFRRFKFIILNENCPENLLPFVCAHELGHSILHRGVNTPFLKRNTLFSVDRIEKEANTFAVELLLPDDLLVDYEGMPISSVARFAGIPEGLEDLKTLSNKFYHEGGNHYVL